MKVFSTKVPTNIPSPPDSTSGTEFRLSEVCAYYEDLYPGATPTDLIGYLNTHIQGLARQEQEDQMAATAAAVAAAQQPQFAQPMGQEAQYGYQAQAQYAPAGVQQYGQQTYGADPMQQGYGAVDPNLLQTQQAPMYYPQTPQWGGYGGGTF